MLNFRYKFLKSLLATQFAMSNNCRAEFWEFLPGGRQTVEILKSQLATKLTIWNKYRARFWEILPGGRQTVLLADRGGGGGGGRRECAREGALCVEGLFFFSSLSVFFSSLFVRSKKRRMQRRGCYGVATISRLFKITGLFCKRAL